MLERIMENTLTHMYEEFMTNGRTSYEAYELNLVPADMERMLKMLRNTGLFKHLEKIGQNKIRCTIDEDAIELYFSRNKG